MNSVFLNYDTSYFDLLNTDALLPSYGSNKLIKSLDGKLVESDVSLDTSEFEDQFYTNKDTLGFGERRAFNPDFRRVQIGYWLNATAGYPDMSCDIHPTTTLHHGLKFSQNPSKYNSSDLWVNNSGVLNYRDRGVVSVGNSVVPVVGNIPIFGSATYGAIEDSGFSLDGNSFSVNLSCSNISGARLMVNLLSYKLGTKVDLFVQRKLFQGDLEVNGESSGGFFSEDLLSFLPVGLRPLDEVSVPILIYQQDTAGTDKTLINQVGYMKIKIDGYMEIFKDPAKTALFDADSGDFDGWSTFSISYYTL